MDGYKLVRAGVTTTVKYGTTVAAGIAGAVMRNLNDTRCANRLTPNVKPHKHPMQGAAMDLAFLAGGFVIGDHLAEKTGAWMDGVYDRFTKAFKPEKTDKNETDEDPITVDFVDL